MGWADRQLEREAEGEKATRYHEEKAVREARIKDQRGPLLFDELKEYLAEQVQKYNSGKKSTVFVFEADVQAALHVDRGNRDIRIKRRDGARQPLTLIYSPTTHILEWKCGAGRGSFLLRVREEGTVYFETPHHVYMSIEEIGDELLSKFAESTI